MVTVRRLTLEELRADRENLREQLKIWEALEERWGTPENLAERIGMVGWLIDGHREEGE